MKKTRKTKQQPCYSCNTPIALKVKSQWLCVDCIKEEGLVICTLHGEWYRWDAHCITCARKPMAHCSAHEHYYQQGARCIYCDRAPKYNHEITPDDRAWLATLGVSTK